MPVFRLDERLLFPPPELAEEGLLAIGGDLSTERLLLAYAAGIFPWYEEGQPLLWHSPDPRLVLLGDELHVPRRLERTLRAARFRISFDEAFAAVIDACARAPRPGQCGTWITREMRAAYKRLHREGWAHSAEAWLGDRLAGGLYGVSLGGVFFGESMFTRAPDASKVAFVALVRALTARGVALVDCQVTTEHLQHFGARKWSRERFLAALKEALHRPTLRGNWGGLRAGEKDLSRGATRNAAR
ncbi:MAG TPA: leucyl/phenylalanyl-tRNA--protein transferase [Candidatus Methanoperedens sp.]|nr:leucyl/phenylalanyl-tRNA--protein transferase [Candidatus Methanoperedens sp.]